MDEKEVQDLVAKRFKGKVVPPPRRVRAWAWFVEVVHPLLHHKVRHVAIGANGAIQDLGWCCRICGRPMR
jgi:hypothetical protein